MQADLFNISLSNSFEREAFQRSFFEKKFTLRTDQLLALGLVMIVFFVLVFAWGMEHGKAVSHREMAVNANLAALNAPPKPVEAAEAPLTQVEPAMPAPVDPLAPAIEVVGNPVAEAVSVPAATEIPAKAKYTIAHIIYLKKDQAKKEVEKIKGKGQAARFVSSGKYFQIIVGGFESRKAATDAMKTMQIQGVVSPDAYVRNMPASVS